MKDKLIIIATIQNMLKSMTELMMDAPGQKSIEKQGVLKGVSFCLLHMYFAITGNHWQGSPKELMQWMVNYTKDEARKLDGGPERLIVTEVN